MLWQLTAVTICGARTGSSIGVEWGAHRTGVSRSELSLVVTLTSGSSATSESERRQLEGGNRASLPPDPSLCEEISPTTVSFLSKGAKAPRRQGEPARRAARQARPRRVIRNTGEKWVLRILLIFIILPGGVIASNIWGKIPSNMRVFYVIPNTHIGPMQTVLCVTQWTGCIRTLTPGHATARSRARTRGR